MNLFIINHFLFFFFLLITIKESKEHLENGQQFGNGKNGIENLQVRLDRLEKNMVTTAQQMQSEVRKINQKVSLIHYFSLFS